MKDGEEEKVKWVKGGRVFNMDSKTSKREGETAKEGERSRKVLKKGEKDMKKR